MATTQAARAQWASKDEEYAFYRRRAHDHIEAMQDYVIARLAELAHARFVTQAEAEGLDPATVIVPAMPPKARQVVSALQGSHGGGAVPFEEFERDQLTLAALLGFSGQESARRSRVRDWLKTLDAWHYLVGARTFTIIPGGEIVGYRDDSSPICTKTKFIDHLLPNADAGVQRARLALDRAFAAWRANGSHGKKPNVGAYMAAEADRVIKQLPAVGTPAESGAKAPGETQPLALGEYVKRRREIIEAESKRIADRLTAGDLIKPAEIEERLAMLDVAHEKAVRALDDDWLSARKLLQSAQKTVAMRAANLCDAAEAVADVDEILAARGHGLTPVEHYADGNTTTCEKITPPAAPESGPLGKKKLTQAPPENKAKTMLEAALEYARNVFPVFPVRPDKTPYTPNGFKDATTNEATIRAWWRKWPAAGIAVPTGRAAGWLVLDRDDRHGGDAAEVGAPVDQILAEKGNAHGPLSAPAAPPEAAKKGATSENIMLQEALTWAGAGVAVFPGYETFDGVCACATGSECRNNGKHPRWHAADLPNGKDNATTNPEQIKIWWTRWPHANICGRMGSAANLLAVDVDPRSGGSASLTDLTEAHGDEWLQTRCHKTGGGGWHFFFSLPEGVEVHKAKLAPGIDLKHGNGYVLLPPSTHASGRTYEVESDAPILPAPAWLVAELTRERDAQPATVINFQDGKDRRAQFGMGARHFGEGERNDGLRDVMCGRWVHGWAVDAQDLYEQARAVRDLRCASAPGDPPPSDRELWDMAQRTTRKFARGTLRQVEGRA